MQKSPVQNHDVRIRRTFYFKFTITKNIKNEQKQKINLFLIFFRILF